MLRNFHRDLQPFNVSPNKFANNRRERSLLIGTFARQTTPDLCEYGFHTESEIGHQCFLPATREKRVRQRAQPRQQCKPTFIEHTAMPTNPQQVGDKDGCAKRGTGPVSRPNRLDRGWQNVCAFQQPCSTPHSHTQSQTIRAYPLYSHQ